MDEMREKALSLPNKPGVYLMLARSGAVIYVGKAKSLKHRVSSYFHSAAAHSGKTKRMLAHVADFDCIIAGSEFEALVLECSLIRRHQPRYNILLKYGGGYPFVRVDMASPYPSLTVTYSADAGEGSVCFGPYGSYSLSKSVVTALSQALRLPVCARRFPRDIGKGRPCLQAHLHRCIAVCSGGVSREEYRAVIKQAVAMLEGKAEKLIKGIENDMLAASDSMLYEKAAALRDKHRALGALMRRQIVVGGGMADTDAIGCHIGSAKAGIAVLHYKGGDLISRDMVFTDNAEDCAELLGSFLTQYYPARSRAPKEILLSAPVENTEDIALLIHGKTGVKPRVTVPARGTKKALVALAEENAREETERVAAKEEKTARLLAELQKRLGLARPPRRIEAADISNTGESERVGAIACFQDGKPAKKSYRFFIIRDGECRDDYHAMEEMLTRRFRRYAEKSAGFDELPDLLLVDGGAAHAAMAARVAAAYAACPVFGMVKNEKHRTRALVTPQNEEIDLSAFPAGFALIAKIQEETHRSASEFHHKRRSRFTGELDGIPGVGGARKRALLEHFSGIGQISRASEEELSAVVPAAVAAAIRSHFRASP
ncbi:MAG: excinuclease ABC subunit UvrC [Oscillospiraceae bacterium]|jgi:excinuclease ABC subunit C|nr:excinuclease ABC subunit UvrC [Oscillospiraceae bacterium]